MLAFPCNQFGAQEPGTDAEILAFATDKYAANFPMFSKISVNGPDAAPLYEFLKQSRDLTQTGGSLSAPDASGDIPWNFAKFLVDGAGQVIARYAPPVTPEAIGEVLRDYLNDPG